MQQMKNLFSLMNPPGEEKSELNQRMDGALALGPRYRTDALSEIMRDAWEVGDLGERTRATGLLLASRVYDRSPAGRATPASYRL